MTKELKKLMTRVAKGEISEKEALETIKPKKTAEKEPKEKNKTLKREN